VNAKSPFQQCLGLLPSLSDDEKRQVAIRLSYLLQGAGGAPIDEAYPGEDLLLDCITAVLKGNGLEYASIALLKKQAGYPTFKAKVPGVARFLNQRRQLSRQDLRAMFAFALELLIEDMQSMNMAIGARNIMNHIHRIPSVVNRAFPGYAQSGLLELLIKRKA